MTLPTQDAQRGLEALHKVGLLNCAYEFKRTQGGITVPLNREPSDAEVDVLRKKLVKFEITQADFKPIHSRPKSIQDALQIPSTTISKAPRSFDLIGDIAIVEIPADLIPFSSQIGKAVLEVNPHVRLVLQKSSDVMGTFRTRKFQALAGNGTTETVYHEFSCRYKLDVAEVYFNPRLSHERMRVARQVKQDEIVVDMFAGVGPYSILIAKSEPTSKVFSIDINPTAVAYLKQNIFANRVADRVIPLLGDAGKLSTKEVHKIADRIIMNLPSEAGNYIGAAMQTLRVDGGRVHFYEFVGRNSTVDSVKDSFETLVEAQNRKVESFEFCNVIRETSPGNVEVAIDAVIT